MQLEIALALTALLATLSRVVAPPHPVLHTGGAHPLALHPLRLTGSTCACASNAPAPALAPPMHLRLIPTGAAAVPAPLCPALWRPPSCVCWSSCPLSSRDAGLSYESSSIASRARILSWSCPLSSSDAGPSPPAGAACAPPAHAATLRAQRRPWLPPPVSASGCPAAARVALLSRFDSCCIMKHWSGASKSRS